MPDGIWMTGAEFKAAWQRTVWVVTENTYPPGHGGLNFGSTVEVRFSTVSAYAAWGGAAGLTFLLLHEMAHNTPYAQSAYANLWQGYLQNPASGVWGPSNQYFVSNEQNANEVARTIAGAFGWIIPSTLPTHGYPGP